MPFHIFFDATGDLNGGVGVDEASRSDLHGARAGEDEFYSVSGAHDAAYADNRHAYDLRYLIDHAHGYRADSRA